ncbi:MAG: bifunctional DNA-formamidopyrimidine glycosylase/DNA-(apurinic or apyrimidinic site) lyase [Deltaproteobacteria bacterium]|nr:bifunctional DNA-formamidopyrimidine glycosylase/DNA-(apurinic or apyrimidinic site) lyase [Deltaproteobacteria bacterium]
MPELPEVETVRAGLDALLRGRVIARVEVLRPMLRFRIAKELPSVLEGARVVAVERRAKYLLVRTDKRTLLSHLGMTGTWQHVTSDHVAQKHDHLRLDTDDGTTLVYNDPRKFGFVELLPADSPAPRLAALGPEPLDPSAFNADYLVRVFRKRKAPVKSLLMDQAIVVGVGNIYAAEALFRAGIHPKRAATTVKRERLVRLVACVRDVLNEAIAAGGSTIDDYRKTNGQSGYFQHTFAVYAREGEPCLGCGTTLKLARIGGRSSVYCGKCQR